MAGRDLIVEPSPRAATAEGVEGPVPIALVVDVDEVGQVGYRSLQATVVPELRGDDAIGGDVVRVGELLDGKHLLRQAISGPGLGRPVPRSGHAIRIRIPALIDAIGGHLPRAGIVEGVQDPIVGNGSVVGESLRRCVEPAVEDDGRVGIDRADRVNDSPVESVEIGGSVFDAHEPPREVLVERIEAECSFGVRFIDGVVGDDSGMRLQPVSELSPELEGLAMELPVLPESRVVLVVVQLSPARTGQAEHRQHHPDAVAMGFVEGLSQQRQVGLVDLFEVVGVADQEVPVLGWPSVRQDANVFQADIARGDVPLGTMLRVLLISTLALGFPEAEPGCLGVGATRAKQREA